MSLIVASVAGVIAVLFIIMGIANGLRARSQAKKVVEFGMSWKEFELPAEPKEAERRAVTRARETLYPLLSEQ